MLPKERMKRAAKKALIVLRRALGYGLLVTAASMIAIAVYVLEKREDLSIWHEVVLQEEFSRFSRVDDFDGYMALEERLFREVEDRVYAKTEPGNSNVVNRYRKGSLSDPTSKGKDWNRTFVMRQDEPEAGILLLHGLSDSPYSMRSLGDSFHESGGYVVGLRIPGHGTLPSGLVDVSWKDWAAAVRLAVVHLKKEVGDKPIHLVGYSNGGALAVNYCLESLQDDTLPEIDRLLLLSPEMGVSRAAGLAVWQGRIGHWLGLEKLAWNSISAEYDPYKYGSFAVNAGDQAYRITRSIDKRLGKLSEDGGLGGFPKVLAFQSVSDATVSAPAVVTRLFDRLPGKGHELVFFDVNRNVLVEHLLIKNPREDLRELVENKARRYALSVVTNAENGGEVFADVNVESYAPGSAEAVMEATGSRWPTDVYSLSHVALPFPKTDPVYGDGDGGTRATLGNLTLRGERGVLYISSKDMLRQRWNPFYPWMEEQALRFLGNEAERN